MPFSGPLFLGWGDVARFLKRENASGGQRAIALCDPFTVDVGELQAVLRWGGGVKACIPLRGKKRGHSGHRAKAADAGMEASAPLAEITRVIHRLRMGNNLTAILGIIVWFAIPLMCIWASVEGLRNGVVRARGGSYSRAENPIWFWLCICMYLGLACWVIYLSVRMALNI